MKTGIELIEKERKEQIEKHDFETEYDFDENSMGELKFAAINILGISEITARNLNCRWGEIEDYVKTKTEIEKLTIAGALIAAEIDRLQYKAG